MRYSDLFEKTLVSEFLMGFELEAYYLPTREERDQSTSTISTILNKIKDAWPLDRDPIIKKDSSLDQCRPANGHAFEYASRPFSITPYNIKSLIEFLQSLGDLGFITNECCGFHIHVSWPTLDDQSTCWVVMQMALDDSIKSLLSKFKEWDFVDWEFASSHYLNGIKTAFEHKNWDAMKPFFSSSIGDKRRLVRMHPQGTLEWRGPRGFLDTGSMNDIKDFVKHLWMFIRWLSTAISATEVDGISRSEFDKHINVILYKKDRIVQVDILTAKLFKNPKLAKTITDPELISNIISDNPQLIQYFNKDVIRGMKKWFDVHYKLYPYAIKFFSNAEILNTFTTNSEILQFIEELIHLPVKYTGITDDRYKEFLEEDQDNLYHSAISYNLNSIWIIQQLRELKFWKSLDYFQREINPH